MSKIDELRLGFETAYIDGLVVSNNIYRPQFVSNNHKEGKSTPHPLRMSFWYVTDFKSV